MGRLVRSLVVLIAIASSARADRPAGLCIDVGVSFVPSDQLQIVVWVEDTRGHFVDTIYVTSKIGRYGLGNRPGRFDFNSGSPIHDSWPYGRRITTFPVWAHRHGKTFPVIVPQNGDDNQLSHPFDQSSVEDTPPFCMPMLRSDPNFDAVTCASVSYSDKGTFAATGTSLYPPRADITRNASVDSASVDTYRGLNPFDAITQATPPAGVAAQLHWAAPASVPIGDYVLLVEVARSYDMNATYNETTFPSPVGIPYAEYGMPYRGQPSVVYATPFRIDTTANRTMSSTYVGYGDPSGADGMLRPPDATITTDTPGAGASRLQLVSDAGATYRLRVDMQPTLAADPPSAPGALVASAIASTTATLTFLEPMRSPTQGRIVGYDVRVRAESPITDDNFDSSMPVTATIVPVGPGAPQTVELTGLLPETPYWIGIRASDGCGQHGSIAVAPFTTTAREAGEVSACFIATAAYGSILANDVEMLRRFRDVALRSNALGELAVETYYTFGPPVAAVVGQSELLRATARGALDPVVARARKMRF
jgi:hypothetical protein